MQHFGLQNGKNQNNSESLVGEAHNVNAKEDQKDVLPSEEGIAWLAHGKIEKNETENEGLMMK